MQFAHADRIRNALGGGAERPVAAAAKLAPRLNAGEATGARLHWWMLALIAISAIAVYANSLRNGFAYDDCGVISNNPRVLELQWTEMWKTGYWPEWEGTPDVLYRPLTIWSYAANQFFTPTSQWAFHLVNVLLHAITSVLVGILASRFLSRRSAGLIAGLLFALHPIHTEAVANVVGRGEILAAMWSLLALLVMLPAEGLLAGAPARRGWWHGWLVAACFLLAMFSKETPAALLGGILFLDIWRWSLWPTGRPALWRWMASQCARYYVPLGTAFGIYMAMRMNAVGFMSKLGIIHPMVNPLVGPTVTAAQRIVTPFVLIARYLKLMAWPKVLLADYSAPSIMPESNLLHAPAALGILLVLAAGLLIVTQWKKRPGVVAALVLLAFSYALAANFLRIGTIFAERLFYLPSAFVIIVAAAAAVGVWGQLQQLEAPKALRVMAACAGLAVCGLLAARTVTRNPDWKDNLNLALATAADNPSSSKALCWAAQVISENVPDAAAREFAIDLFKRSADLYPTNGQAYWELAKHYDRVGKLDQSIIYLAMAARFYAGKADTRTALSGARDDLRHYTAKEYCPGIDKNLHENPNNPAAQFAAGLAAWSYGDLDNAEKFIRRSLELDPTFEEARMELGLLRSERGDPVEGAELMKRYIKLAGFNIKARCQYIGVLLKIDATEHPEALDEAQRQLAAASQMLSKDPSLNDLRRELLEKRAALQPHPATAPLSQSTGESLSHAGPRPY